MKPGKAIQVLLSTYQGHRFLEQQLDSLLRQSFDDFEVPVRDDGSSDQTCAILEKYRHNYPGLFTSVRAEKNIGYAKSFFSLLNSSTSPYVMFCDQDDIWLPGKIEVSYRRMIQEEERLKGPILVHTYVEVYDGKTSIAAESNLAKRRKLGTNYYAQAGYAQGCTCMLNAPLTAMCRRLDVGIDGPLPFDHDGAAELVAKLFGRVVLLPETTVRYRVHGNNASIRKSSSWAPGMMIRSRKTNWRLMAYRAILEAFVDMIDPALKVQLRRMRRFEKENRIVRIYLVIRYRFFVRSSSALKSFIKNFIYILNS